MAKVTPGNRLYFYQLFSTQIGFGKQVRITQVEEVLSEADVLLDDVDCATIDELMTVLSDFVKLTVFKGGRRFVTIVKNEDIEADLQRAEDLAASKKAAASAGKAWKHGRASRVPSPAKPRHKRRPKPESVAPAADAATPDSTPVVDQDVKDEGIPDAATSHESALLDADTPEENVPGEQTADDGEPGEGDHGGDVPGEQTANDGEPGEGDHGRDVPDNAPSATDAKDTQQAGTHAASLDQGPAVGAPDQEPPLSLTITYRPPAVQDDEETTGVSETEMEENAETPSRVRTQDAGPSFPEHAIRWPESISDEVFCSERLLFGLYQALPGNIGILDALDEGWRLAQEAGTLEGTRTMVTFPLSRRIEGNPPIEVTIRRTPRIPSGKDWSLTNVDTGLD